MDPEEARKRAHRRGQRSRVRRRIELLLVVVGLLALAIAAIIFALSTQQTYAVRGRLAEMSLAYAAGGAGLLLLHGLAFALPEWRRRRSDQRRRRGDYRDMSVTGEPESGTPDKRAGMVLIYVLVVVGLIAALVVQAQVASRGALRRAEAELVRGDLRRAAADAARAALVRIADDETPDFDGTNETWAATESVVTPGGISTEVSVQDMDRYFDLNNLGAKVAPGTRTAEDILADLFIQSGNFTPSSLLDSLQDWVDADQDGIYEASHYAKKKPEYDPADRTAYTWSELLGAEGATRDVFLPRPRFATTEAFKLDFVDGATVIPARRERPLTINLNTATRGALLAVFGLAQERLVNTVIVLRALRPITSLDSIRYASDPLLFESVRDYLDVKSRFFRVSATAEKGDRAETILVIASRGGEGRVEVLQWIY
ncbi:MAG TPA: hypothetical protein VIH35_08235 [Kiritimatiellia bacterium]|jgi:type II secretory pathway component PulK